MFFLLLLLFVLLLLFYRTQTKTLACFATQQNKRLYWLYASLLLGAVFFANAALQKKTPQLFPKQTKVLEIKFLLDTSLSMAATDTTLGISRLEEGKQIIEHITANLKGQKVSLEAFTEDTERLVPSTNDYLFLKIMLEYGATPAGGTDFVTSFKTLLSNKENDKTHVIVLSDGEDEVKNRSDEETLSQIKALLQENPLSLTTIGLGTKEGAPIPHFQIENKAVRTSLHEGFLSALSKLGNGHFYIANNYSASSLGKMIAEKLTPEEEPMLLQEQQKDGVDTLILFAILSACSALLLRPNS